MIESSTSFDGSAASWLQLLDPHLFPFYAAALVLVWIAGRLAARYDRSAP